MHFLKAEDIFNYYVLGHLTLEEYKIEAVQCNHCGSIPKFLPGTIATNSLRSMEVHVPLQCGTHCLDFASKEENGPYFTGINIVLTYPGGLMFFSCRTSFSN
jgi:hypothetical protein